MSKSDAVMDGSAALIRNFRGAVTSSPGGWGLGMDGDCGMWTQSPGEDQYPTGRATGPRANPGSIAMLLLCWGAWFPIAAAASTFQPDPQTADSQTPDPQNAASWPADVALEMSIRDRGQGVRGLEASGQEGPAEWRLRALDLEVHWRWAYLGRPVDFSAAPDWRALGEDAHPHVRRAAWRWAFRAAVHSGGIAEPDAAHLLAPDSSAFARLIEDANEPWGPLRAAAVEYLGLHAWEAAGALLRQRVGDSDDAVAMAAAMACARRLPELPPEQGQRLALEWIVRFDANNDPADRFANLVRAGATQWSLETWSALWRASGRHALGPERRALIGAGLQASLGALTGEAKEPSVPVRSWLPYADRALKSAPDGRVLFEAAFWRGAEEPGRWALEHARSGETEFRERWMTWARRALGGEAWGRAVLEGDVGPEWFALALGTAGEDAGFGRWQPDDWALAAERTGQREAWFEALTRAAQEGGEWAVIALLEALEERDLQRRLRALTALGAVAPESMEQAGISIERVEQVRAVLWETWLDLDDELALEHLPDLAERTPDEDARDRLSSLGRFNTEGRGRLGAVLSRRLGDPEVRLTLERWLAEEPFAFDRHEPEEQRRCARRAAALLGHLHSGFPDRSQSTATDLLGFAIGRSSELGRQAVRVLEQHPDSTEILIGLWREGVELETRAEAMRAVAAAGGLFEEGLIEQLSNWILRDVPRLSPRQAGELLAVLPRVPEAPVRAAVIELLGASDDVPFQAAECLARIPGEESASALAAGVRRGRSFGLRRAFLAALGEHGRTGGDWARSELERLARELADLVARPAGELVTGGRFRQAEAPLIWGALYDQCREAQALSGAWDGDLEAQLWALPLAGSGEDLSARFEERYLARADARWPLTWGLLGAIAARGELAERMRPKPEEPSGAPWWRADARGLLDLGERFGAHPGVTSESVEALVEAAAFGLLGEGPRARGDLRRALHQLEELSRLGGDMERAAKLAAARAQLAPGWPWPG